MWALGLVAALDGAFDLSSPHEGLDAPAEPVMREPPAESARPSARHTEPEPTQAMSVDEFGTAEALVQVSADTEHQTDVAADAEAEGHHGHAGHHARPERPERHHQVVPEHHQVHEHQHHEERRPSTHNSSRARLDADAEQVLQDYGSRRDYAKLKEAKRMRSKLHSGLVAGRKVLVERKQLVTKQEQLSRDLQKMETLKEVEANMIDEIKANQRSLHRKLFANENAAAADKALAAAEARAFRDKITKLAYCTVAVVVITMLGALYQTSRKPQLGTAWLAPFKRQAEEPASTASTDAAGEVAHA